MRKRFYSLVNRWTHPGWIGSLRRRSIRLIAVSGIIFCLGYGLLNIEESFASGNAELQSTPHSGIVFLDASTDDSQGTLDPGYSMDVASCTARVRSDNMVYVSIRNEYPSYTCTFITTIFNNSTLPACLESMEFYAPPALTITGLEGEVGLLLGPGRQAVQAFSLHVEQVAKPRVTYRFRISELFRTARSRSSRAFGGDTAYDCPSLNNTSRPSLP